MVFSECHRVRTGGSRAGTWPRACGGQAWLSTGRSEGLETELSYWHGLRDILGMEAGMGPAGLWRWGQGLAAVTPCAPLHTATPGSVPLTPRPEE